MGILALKTQKRTPKSKTNQHSGLANPSILANTNLDDVFQK